MARKRLRGSRRMWRISLRAIVRMRRIMAGPPPRWPGRRRLRASPSARPAIRSLSSRGEPRAMIFRRIDDRQPMAALDFVHVVRRDEGRRPAGRKLVDEVPEVAPRRRIDARRRLVEEEDVGLVDDGAAEGETLLPAAAQLPGQGFLPADEAGHADDPRPSAPASGPAAGGGSRRGSRCSRSRSSRCKE